MSSFDLTRAIQNTLSGGVIEIPPGEFQGTWVLSKPVHLLGSGLSTVLWQEKGPVLTIQSPGIKLSNLSVEVMEDGNGLALEVTNSIQSLPQFNGVRVLGKVSGLSKWDSWNFPPVIDLGKIKSKTCLERTIGISTSNALHIRSSMSGLTAEVGQSLLGQRTLKLALDGEILNPGALLDGLLEIEMDGIFTLVRITGEVYTTVPTVASSRAGDAQYEGSDIFFSVTPGIRRPDPTNTAPDPSPRKPQPKPHSTSPTVDQLLADAEGAERRQEIETAEILLKQAEQLKPTEPRIHRLLASFYERHNNLADAMIYWEFLHKVENDNIEVLLKLTKCYNQTNRYQNVIALLEKSLHLPQAKTNVEIFRSLAFAYYHVDRIEEAIWALERALAIKDDRKLILLLKTWKQQIA